MKYYGLTLFFKVSKYLAGVSCILITIFFFSCDFSREKEETESVSQYASLDDSTHYVGMASCRQCHSAIYDTYVQTGMGQSFAHAGREKSSAHFGMDAIVHDSLKGFYYHPYWEGDSLFVKEFYKTGKDTIYSRNEKIDYIVGSGQHTNSHIRSVNDYLYQVPVTFYTQKNKWDLPPGFENGFNSRFDRKIELECMSCHNGMPELVPGSENKYLNVPNGIDCERCHGPGSKHVAEKMSGNFVDTSKYIDFSIVNPSKLPIALQMDVCQRCHIQGNAVLKEGKSFTDFKPGMKLSSVMNVFMPVYKGDENAHIMASHVERLKMSQCFIVSAKNAEKNEQKNSLRPYKNAMTCISCHNPHVSVKQTGKEVFNNACISCHHSGKDKITKEKVVDNKQIECSEDEKRRTLLGNNCVSCHMPKSGSIDIPHVSTTDHFIRKSVTDKDLNKIREFIGLACINNPEVDSIERGKAFISYYEKFSSNIAFLDSASKLIRHKAPEEIKANYKTLIHLAFLKKDFPLVIRYLKEGLEEKTFTGVVSKSNSDAWTAYRIGQSYFALNDLRNAIQFYQIAVNLASFQADFRNKLASAQHDAGLLKEAKINYNFIIKENPKYVSAYTNLGYLLLSTENDVRGAEAMYNNALALDPFNEQAMLNKVGVLVYSNRNDEAKILLKSLIKHHPQNLQATKLYSRLIGK